MRVDDVVLSSKARLKRKKTRQLADRRIRMTEGVYTSGSLELRASNGEILIIFTHVIIFLLRTLVYLDVDHRVKRVPAKSWGNSGAPRDRLSSWENFQCVILGQDIASPMQLTPRTPWLSLFILRGLVSTDNYSQPDEDNLVRSFNGKWRCASGL